jgi:hypothetical protein
MINLLVEVLMQKRDKFGRFFKETVTKKCARKVKNRIVVKLEKTKIKGSPLPISLFDLQDMIEAEVAFQLKDRW